MVITDSGLLFWATFYMYVGCTILTGCFFYAQIRQIPSLFANSTGSISGFNHCILKFFVLFWDNFKRITAFLCSMLSVAYSHR